MARSLKTLELVRKKYDDPANLKNDCGVLPKLPRVVA
jgi:hypothetical protein